MASKIDAAIAKIIKEGEGSAHRVISDNKELMHKLAKDLLKKEVFNQEEFDSYFPKAKKKKVTT